MLSAGTKVLVDSKTGPISASWLLELAETSSLAPLLEVIRSPGPIDIKKEPDAVSPHPSKQPGDTHDKHR